MTMTSRGPAELESSDPELDAPEPLPATTFEQLGVAPELVAVLHSQGITAPFPVQALTIPDGIAGRDVCGKAKTGRARPSPSGCPCSCGPARAAPTAPAALVLVPTRELAVQVADVLEPLGKRRAGGGRRLRRGRHGAPDQGSTRASTSSSPRRDG